MKYDRIEGIDKDISKLVMGCDNQDDINEASKLWDHWIEVGGNMFDTAFIYGGGNHEKVLGQWLKNNNNRKDVLILGKGAHTPDCNPEAISKQLTISLERMNTDYVDEAIGVWFEELMNSPEVYVLEGYQTDITNSALNTYVQPVRLITSNYTRKTIANDKLMQYTFEVEKSKMKKQSRRVTRSP